MSSILISCGSAVKLITGIPKLNVYSQEEIDGNIAVLPKADNVFDAQLSAGLYETEIKNFIYMSIPYKTYVYDSDDSLLCIRGNNYCTIDQLNEMMELSIAEKYERCNTETKDADIEDYLGNFEVILKKLNISPKLNFKNTDYKVLVFMNTDISKGQIIDDWSYIYSSLDEENLLFIRVWTDLNVNWGLNKSKKAKFKVRRVKNSKGEYEMTLKSLPYKN